MKVTKLDAVLFFLTLAVVIACVCLVLGAAWLTLPQRAVIGVCGWLAWRVHLYYDQKMSESRWGREL